MPVISLVLKQLTRIFDIFQLHMQEWVWCIRLESIGNFELLTNL